MAEGNGGSGSTGIVAIVVIFLIVAILAVLLFTKGNPFSGGGGTKKVDINISTPGSK